MNKKTYSIGGKRFDKKTALRAAALLALLLPLGVLAASSGPTAYTPLAPLPPDIVPPGNGTNLLVSYIPGVFKLMIIITILLSVVYIVLGGVQYVSTDSWSNKNDGRKKLEDALTGLGLAIVAYLILYTINPNLTGLNFNLQYTPSTAGGGLSTGTGGVAGSGPAVGSVAVGGISSDYTLTSAQAVTVLNNNNITAPGVSLNGIQATTITGIANLENVCNISGSTYGGCEGIVITSALDGTHSTNGTITHGNGFKVDVSDHQGAGAAAFSQFLNKEITSQTGAQTIAVEHNYTIAESGTSYTIRYDNNTNAAGQVIPGQHWDVAVNP